MRKFITKKDFCVGKHYYFFVLFCFLGQFILAQNVIQGTVSDSSNMPLAGVNIVEKGTSNGVVSDFDGLYSITVDGEATLVFSYLGFVTKEIRVTTSSTQNVQLEDDLESLDEVVVIGYGSQLKEELSGSVSSVDVEALEKVPQVSVDQMLQGRAAGVTVTQNSGQPGGAVSVKIRGVNSINGSTEPLYIIDGVPVSGDSQNTSGSGRNISNSSSPLASINPRDIASMNVLKDASATAIYGSRGANGVVIITTKKGKNKEGKVSYSSYTGIQQPTNILPVLNLRDYAAFQNEMRQVFGLSEVVEFRRPELLGEGTNWQKEIFDNAMMQNHQLSFTGGSERSQYYMSVGYTDQEGTVKGSGFERYSARLNLDSQVKKSLKVGISLTATRTNENLILNGNSRGIVSLALRNNPGVAVFNPDGSYAGPITQEEISLAVPNPIAEIENTDNTYRRDRILGNIYAELKIIDGLTYRPEFGGDFGFNDNNVFGKTYSYGEAVGREDAELTRRKENTNFWIIKNLLTYNTTIADDHNITVLAGHEAQESSWNGVISVGRDFVDNTIPTLNLSNAETHNVDEFKGSNSLESYFGRLIYSFGNKYNVTASIRADGSSKFSEGNKWGYFPSVSAAWRLSNEKFMEGFDAIENIKVYGGYGEVGNQAITNFAYGSRLESRGTGLGTGFTIANFPNPDLKWETSKQINAGVDFSLFNGHLQTTVEVYRKVSSDFLFQLALTDFALGGTNTGLGSIAPQWVNLGEMENKGIDLTLNFDTLSSGDFSWNSTLTFSHYKNKVLELKDEVTINGQTNLLDTNEILTETSVGQPIGVFYGYQVEGLFRTLDDLNGAPIQFGQPVGDASVAGRTWVGDIKYKDVNGDGIVDPTDRTVIGNPHPDFTFGWQNNLSYKNFDLAFFLQGSVGNDIFNANGRTLTTSNLTYRNQLESVRDFWSPQNTNSTHPRYTQNATSNIFISDRYIEDGSYLRIQNVRLGYNLPSEIFEKIGLSRVNIYGSVQNLYTFTDYSGYDPEVGSLNQNPLLQGVDNGRYPTPRTFTVGLDIEF
ncbi:TonB-dependent receptor [uncultured Algibacter sp.]|uniref:SusC/RagA family TonB-linked outer membrane protein n=1 Tax=uncultured Algibacter sp. TaxID=298659 RepID=UPI002621FD6E|nr:TonB-dependent receptor [uncultured Algibacter sp.]